MNSMTILAAGALIYALVALLSFGQWCLDVHRRWKERRHGRR